jgi:hypothetical protein
MIVMDDAKVNSGLDLIREHIPAGEAADPAHARVTIYVLDVKDFDRVK